MENIFLFKDNDDFSVALYKSLEEKCNYDLSVLNPVQKKLFLCMLLENFGQAESILAFLQENYPQYSNEVIDALREIGASKSADIIAQAVALLPADGTWFFDASDAHSEAMMAKLETDFSNYPDGFLSDLYRKYAETHKKEVLL
ncbi:hypothetical protein [Capnocytophaga sp.]|uniref:DMP19 family protein n=1 Tax=Capnocytophaga sp. TaxID=44737 RepID=UPI0026DC5290|nr:hypothetical protein [Capnocytophaga sp.]MDO5105455.1 hypothetical protein [Capnocytophaga sp.]